MQTTRKANIPEPLLGKALCKQKCIQRNDLSNVSKSNETTHNRGTAGNGVIYGGPN
jgi:hypothetical protein